MKLNLIAAALLLGTTSIAMAADPALPVEELPAIYDWSGVYVGVQAGYGWSDNDYGYQDSMHGFDGDGFVGGITVGANWQNGAIVYGLEADVSYANVDGSDLSSNNAPCYEDGCSAEIDWFATGRARLGYALDNFLPYITGGVAVGRLEGTADLGACDYPASCSYNDTKFGWTAGAGIEWGLSQQISLKAEYLHMDFGTPDFNNEQFGDPTVKDITLDTVRVGVNYRF